MRDQILVVNPKGKGDLHELRAQRLSEFLNAEITFFNVDRSQSYPRATAALWQIVKSRAWSLIYQESTGIIGGLNLIRASRRNGSKYIVSSGDPIAGFFYATKGKAAGRVFEAYERALYKHCAGYVGWTPYLAGAALHIGAPRAATIEGAVQIDKFQRFGNDARRSARERFGLPAEDIVLGIVGSLMWNPRAKYCYGLELVEILRRVRRTDVSLLIVGDGSGRPKLEERVPPELRGRVKFTGRIPENDVVGAINAMSVGFITQTLDRLGSFRLTTKLPEYLACGLPVAMSPIPGYYDYVGPAAGWALPQQGFHPADEQFHCRCAEWVDGLSREEIDSKSDVALDIARSRFDYNVVGPRFRSFVQSLL